MPTWQIGYSTFPGPGTCTRIRSLYEVLPKSNRLPVSVRSSAQLDVLDLVYSHTNSHALLVNNLLDLRRRLLMDLAIGYFVREKCCVAGKSRTSCVVVLFVYDSFFYLPGIVLVISLVT
jgi:hypothetical protein